RARAAPPDAAAPLVGRCTSGPIVHFARSAHVSRGQHPVRSPSVPPGSVDGMTPGADSATAPDAATLRRWRELLASEREAATLYDRLADSAGGERAEILRELADVERRHAAHWEERLRSAGAEVPVPSEPGLRTRLLASMARRFSLDSVLPLIERAEESDAGV